MSRGRGAARIRGRRARPSKNESTSASRSRRSARSKGEWMNRGRSATILRGRRAPPSNDELASACRPGWSVRSRLEVAARDAGPVASRGQCGPPPNCGSACPRSVCSEALVQGPKPRISRPSDFSESASLGAAPRLEIVDMKSILAQRGRRVRRTPQTEPSGGAALRRRAAPDAGEAPVGSTRGPGPARHSGRCAVTDAPPVQGASR